MKLFLNRIHGCCGMALMVLLATGCTTTPAPPEQGSPLPLAIGAPAASVECPPCDTATSRPEEVQLQKQLEEQTRFQKLLDDLAHYPGLNAEETRRMQADLNSRISATEQDGGNGNRIRLAFLLSLHPAGTNDQRAISLLDGVSKNDKAAASFRRLAGILRVQIQEKQRALQKLDALRDVDRRLLEERMPGSKTSPSKPKPDHP